MIAITPPAKAPFDETLTGKNLFEWPSLVISPMTTPTSERAEMIMPHQAWTGNIDEIIFD